MRVHNAPTLRGAHPLSRAFDFIERHHPPSTPGYAASTGIEPASADRSVPSLHHVQRAFVPFWIPDQGDRALNPAGVSAPASTEGRIRSPLGTP